MPGLAGHSCSRAGAVQHSSLFYVGLVLVVVTWALLSHTSFGLAVTAVGEDPSAADKAGVDVNRARYLAVLYAGAMAGLAGAFLSVADLDTFTEGMTKGAGYLALASVIFGGWTSWRTAVACLLFGAATALQFLLPDLGISVPAPLLLMLPYVMALLAVGGLVGNIERRARSAFPSFVVTETLVEMPGGRRLREETVKKRCLITGGGKGIGRAIALAFAEEGGDVAIIDRNRNAIEATVSDVGALGVKAFGVEADVSDVASTQDAVDRAKSALGGIDVLVNNAGIMSYSPLETMPIEMWDEMMAVNLRSVFLCSRLVIPGMKANRWGRIINLGSQLAQKGAPQLVHYGASKAAVIGFTRSLARELIEFGITVICDLSGADRHRSLEDKSTGMEGSSHPANSDRPLRRSGRNRTDGGASCLRRWLLLRGRRIAPERR